jgi:hypothetical protein
MIRKLVSYYTDIKDAEAAEADTLFMEIGNSQIACMVKGGITQQVEAFELFELDKNMTDWSDIFFELKNLSNILSRSYKETHCYYNFQEALLIPENKFSISAAEDFLALIYGESTRDDVKHDTITTGDYMVNAYRVKKSLQEWVGRQFILYQPHHIYTKILADLFAGEIPATPVLKVQIYADHMIVAVTNHGKLQLIQSFSYQSEEDILYYLMNILRQFHMDAGNAHIDISGRIQPNAVLYQQLNQLFGQMSVETINPADAAAFTHPDYPLHFFTPFYKLAV